MSVPTDGSSYTIQFSDEDVMTLAGLYCHDRSHPHHYDIFRITIPERAGSPAWPGQDLTAICYAHGDRRIDLPTWVKARAVRRGHQRQYKEEKNP